MEIMQHTHIYQTFVYLIFFFLLFFPGDSSTDEMFSLFHPLSNNSKQRHSTAIQRQQVFLFFVFCFSRRGFMGTRGGGDSVTTNEHDVVETWEGLKCS